MSVAINANDAVGSTCADESSRLAIPKPVDGSAHTNSFIRHNRDSCQHVRTCRFVTLDVDLP